MRLYVSSRFRSSRLGGVLLWVVLLGIILVSVAYSSGGQLESNDRFCASCHLEPEETYYRESISPDPAVSLAAFHARDGAVRCIDCHSRRWIPGRLWAQWGGLQNALAYFSGSYRSPGSTTRPVGESGCTKCHSDLTWVSERPGHYHSPWLRKSWRAASGPVNTCEACHPSHQQAAPELDQFRDAEQVETQCDSCHDAAGIVN